MAESKVQVVFKEETEINSRRTLLNSRCDGVSPRL